jgi:xylan 1,4-beta-xylosidase
MIPQRLAKHAQPAIRTLHAAACALRASTLRVVLVASILTAGLNLWAQQGTSVVQIQVHADRSDGPLTPIWNFFGYDEPNYTYAPNGRKLLGELAALSRVPVFIRVHNLFTSGDGSASLKWGSTNVYTEDAAGNPVYSWTIVDRIFDTFHSDGIKPIVEIGFMPEALSTHPKPYRHNFPNDAVSSIYTGWAYPPTDYRKWSELVYQFVNHLRQRYGDAETGSWLWEIWNEPDIGYWQGTAEEYFKLYDFSAAAVLRALPNAKIGGPDSTGPASPKAAEFLRRFLEHCAHQTNFATGKIGAPLDFISFHPKGSPKWLGDHVQMGIARQLASIEQGFKLVGSFPEWSHTPVLLGESDPEGCAACSARNNPQIAYRNGPLYAAYTAEALSLTRALADQEHIHLLGAVTWAFEFEDQPPFEGFRSLATNGIDKPVLNAFRMFGLLGSDRITATSSARLPVENIVAEGVRNAPDINVLAARNGSGIQILIWNYYDDDIRADPASVELTVDGVPIDENRALLVHFRIDSEHSNAFTAWKKIGSPELLSNNVQEELERAGQLQLLNSPEWVSMKDRTLHPHVELPRQGLSLLQLSF